MELNGTKKCERKNCSLNLPLEKKMYKIVIVEYLKLSKIEGNEIIFSDFFGRYNQTSF